MRTDVALIHPMGAALTEPRCILVVEDHADILLMMQVALQRHGYDVRTATNAGDALRILESGDPNLLILDLMMPEISGWDMLALRAADPHLRRIPTIVVTATGAFDELEAQEYGVFAVLPKPFEPARLESLAASGLRAFAQQGRT